MTNARHEGGRCPGQAGRVCSQDSAAVSPPFPPPGSTAALLADPGPDGRFRRAWRAQKIAAWRAAAPLPRPRPCVRAGRITPALRRLSVAEERGRGVRALAGR